MATEGKERKRKAGAAQLDAPHKKSKKATHDDKGNQDGENMQNDDATHLKVPRKHKGDEAAQLPPPSKQKLDKIAVEPKLSRKRAADSVDVGSENDRPIQTAQLLDSATSASEVKKVSKKDSKNLKGGAAVRDVPDADPATAVEAPKKAQKTEKSKRRQQAVTDKDKIFSSLANGDESDVEPSLAQMKDQSRPETSLNTVTHKTKHRPTADTGIEKPADGIGNPEESSDKDSLLNRNGYESDEESAVDGITELAKTNDEKNVDRKSSSDEVFGAENFSESQDESDDNVLLTDESAELLAGFDSDSEDNQDTTLINPDKPVQVPKQAKNQLKKLERKGDDKPGTMYVGHIPHGFYEHQMRAYFSQFGDIKNLRLSRNKKTGASKHYAFIEFESEEVAKIAAQAMDNYLMFGHILKAKFTPSETLHPDTWKGANKRFRRIPHNMLEKKKIEAPKTTEKWEAKIAKEQLKREEKNKKLKDKLGYEIDLPKMKNPGDVFAKSDLQVEGQAAVGLVDESAAGQIEPLLASAKESGDLLRSHQDGSHEAEVEVSDSKQPDAAEASRQLDVEPKPVKTVETPTGTPGKALPAKPMDPDILAQLKTVAKLSPSPHKVAADPHQLLPQEQDSTKDLKEKKKREKKAKKAKQAAPPQHIGATEPVTSETPGVETQAAPAPLTATMEQEVSFPQTSKDIGNSVVDDETGTNITNKKHKKMRARNRHKVAPTGSVAAIETDAAELGPQNAVSPAEVAEQPRKRQKKHKA